MAAHFYDNMIYVNVLSGDDTSRKVTLFLLDWTAAENPSIARKMEVSAVNPFTGETFDTRIVESFQDGVYLTYEVTGSVTFTVKKMNPYYAVVSAVFFD